MNSVKDVLSFLGIFAVFSLPILFMYEAPKSHKATMKLVKPERGIASMPRPATKTCEIIKRVRWVCDKIEEGNESCHRDGFDRVRHCKPL